MLTIPGRKSKSLFKGLPPKTAFINKGLKIAELVTTS